MKAHVKNSDEKQVPVTALDFCCNYGSRETAHYGFTRKQAGQQSPYRRVRGYEHGSKHWRVPACAAARESLPPGIGLYKDYEELFQKNEKLGVELRTVKYDYKLALKQIQTLERQKQDTLRQNAALATAIADLTREVDRLRALLNIDGSNSGIPTSMTAISKHKVIPNSRQKTGKKIGGQRGHVKHKLKKFKDEDVNVRIEHPLETCPHCGCAGLEDSGATIEKGAICFSW